ncbi:MAG: DoxX family protein [Thermodesulfobacteriota bacterium]
MNNLALFLFRILVSAAMILGHGLGKLLNPEPFIQNIVNMGLPMPEISAYLAIAAETLLPLLIIFGLFTRVSALIAGLNMAVAAFAVHLLIFADPFSKLELAFLYMVCFLFIALVGPGGWTVQKLFGTDT